MTALALLAISSSSPRFVYVDPQGYVRLYGSPKVRSLHRHARQPDLSPDGSRFVYWVENDGPQPFDPMIEHDLASGRERIVRWGNFRSPRYAADGQTIYFTEMLRDQWSLLALKTATGKAHAVLVPKNGGEIGPLSNPAPQIDGSTAVHDMELMIRLGADGKILDTKKLTYPKSAENGGEPDYFAPAPDKPNRLLVALWTYDADERLVGTDGHAGALWIYDAKTMAGRRITPSSVGAMRPSWNRDGSAILFSGGRVKGPSGIWSIRPDGSGMRFLTPGDEPSAGLTQTSSPSVR